MSFNKIILMGNLTRDPEIRMTPKGTAVANFGLATNRKFRDESGADREEVCFIDVEAFGKDADNIGKYFTKGKGILVEGRLKLEQWEDKSTKEKRSKHRVTLERFTFLPGGKREDEGGADGAHGRWSASCTRRTNARDAPDLRARRAFGAASRLGPR